MHKNKLNTTKWGAEKTHMDRLDVVMKNQIRPWCCCLPPSSAMAVNCSPIFGFGWSSIDAPSSKLHKVIPCSRNHFPITLECLQECASTKILQQDQSFSIYFDQTKKKGEEIGPRPREKKMKFLAPKWAKTCTEERVEGKEKVIGFIDLFSKNK